MGHNRKACPLYDPRGYLYDNSPGNMTQQVPTQLTLADLYPGGIPSWQQQDQPNFGNASTSRNTEADHYQTPEQAHPYQQQERREIIWGPTAQQEGGTRNPTTRDFQHPIDQSRVDQQAQQHTGIRTPTPIQNPIPIQTRNPNQNPTPSHQVDRQTRSEEPYERISADAFFAQEEIDEFWNPIPPEVPAGNPEMYQLILEGTIQRASINLAAYASVMSRQLAEDLRLDIASCQGWRSIAPGAVFREEDGRLDHVRNDTRARVTAGTNPTVSWKHTFGVSERGITDVVLGKDFADEFKEELRRHEALLSGHHVFPR